MAEASSIMLLILGGLAPLRKQLIDQGSASLQVAPGACCARSMRRCWVVIRSSSSRIRSRTSSPTLMPSALRKEAGMSTRPLWLTRTRVSSAMAHSSPNDTTLAYCHRVSFLPPFGLWYTGRWTEDLESPLVVTWSWCAAALTGAVARPGSKPLLAFTPTGPVTLRRETDCQRRGYIFGLRLTETREVEIARLICYG